MKKISLADLWLPIFIIILYATVVCCRPLLPVDETRYVSVAWEMFLSHGWFKPLTMNFAPYHHKPPMLFWLINLSWFVFGVSRAAALIPVMLASGLVVYLTGTLGQILFPDQLQNKTRARLVMAASVPFIAYSTLMMFDMTIAVFVLLALIVITRYARQRRAIDITWLGLVLGLGVLTKGPVAYLYVIFPILLAPFWQRDFSKAPGWYGGCLAAILLSGLVVAIWLVPVLELSSNQFALTLIWKQTAGRMTGHFANVHGHPFYFYLPFLPLVFVPWIFLPFFWHSARRFKSRLSEYDGTRFVLCWIVPVFIAFSLIRGKQPHYLVPILPGAVLILTLLMREVATRQLATVLTVLVALFVGAHAIAPRALFKSYNLEAVVDYMRAHPDQKFAYCGTYHAEFGFIARLTKPVLECDDRNTAEWMIQHPDVIAVIRYKDPADVAMYHTVLTQPYRSGQMGLFAAP